MDDLEKGKNLHLPLKQRRKQMSTATPAINGMPQGEFSSFPIEVTVGGATMFVLTVDQFLKV